MNLKEPKFWMSFAYIYLFFLLVFIWFFNPDFLNIRNDLLFVPLYVPILISVHLKHKNDEYASDCIWESRYSLITVTIIVVLFALIVNYFK